MNKAQLFNITLHLTEDNNLEITTEYINPNKIASVHGYEYPGTLAAIIRQAITTSLKLEDDLKELIQKL